jgi:hypothetical protein
MPMDKTNTSLFHRLWTKAVGTEGYIKSEWQEFEKILRAVDSPALKIEHPAPPAIPKEVRETLIESVKGEQAWGVLGSDKLNEAYKWLASTPVATDKAVCPGCRECLYSPPRTEKGG